MPTDALTRFREETLRLRGAETKKRTGTLRTIQTRAVLVVALTSDAPPESKAHPLRTLLDEIRTAAEEFRRETESYIAGMLALAETATHVWTESWEAALGNPNLDQAKQAEILRFVLEDCGQQLQGALQSVRDHAGIFDGPLARLDELKARAADFPLFTRECLARWEMLDRPAPRLDRDRIAKAQAAYARGESESIDDVLTRVQAGGPWVKE